MGRSSSSTPADNVHVSPSGNGAQDDRTRLPAFRRGHPCIVVRLVPSQMELDRHACRPRLCGQRNAVGIEQIARPGEYHHRHQGAEIAIQRTDVGMGDIQLAA
jgi:hypothetical protein